MELSFLQDFGTKASGPFGPSVDHGLMTDQPLDVWNNLKKKKTVTGASTGAVTWSLTNRVDLTSASAEHSSRIYTETFYIRRRVFYKSGTSRVRIT